MASRAISVKVPTVKVIKSLETRLAEITKNKADEAKNEEKYLKSYEKYRKDMLDYAVANFKKAENVRVATSKYHTPTKINIDFDIPFGADAPVEPKRDFEQMPEYQYKEIVEDITNALSILKMTDEETVSTSTFKTVSKYL